MHEAGPKSQGKGKHRQPDCPHRREVFGTAFPLTVLMAEDRRCQVSSNEAACVGVVVHPGHQEAHDKEDECPLPILAKDRHPERHTPAAPMVTPTPTQLDTTNPSPPATVKITMSRERPYSSSMAGASWWIHSTL